MIISLVSDWHGMGKTALALQAKDQLHIKYRQFTGPLKAATGQFVEAWLGKEEPHPKLGCSKRQVGDAIAAALTAINHDLPVYIAKQAIEELVRSGYDVIIDDVRRRSEFEWLDNLAKDTGTMHFVLEVMPFPDDIHYPLTLKADTWSNGLEPCGKDAWPEERFIIMNNGTDSFFEVGIYLISRLIEGETTRQASHAAS